ncbi:hypothetical protein PF010_g11344 [Phytophthora fragariae]|uniref:Endo-1,5-alpha-L-arabinanase A n=1 Tax=Phytophthora fragariae TaxID=53985 RepID=A0A6G0L6I1_9STRA|nr:hypothetical protein PF010_g11344 [Phytophthora fragariae]
MKLLFILIAFPLLFAGFVNGYASPKLCTVPGGSKINLAGKDDLWAPDVHKVGDYYHLYCSCRCYERSTKKYNAIDPNLFQVGSQYFLNFGSYWQDIYQVKMKSTPTKTAGEVAYQMAFTSNYEVVDAPSMFSYNGYYYLFFSKGSCCGYDKTRPAKGKEYRILVCRSKHATYGFVDKSGNDCRNNGGTVVVESHDYVYGPGGQGIYNDPKYGPVLYYHYVDTRIGYADGDKKFGWNQLDFSSGWPTV